MSTPINLTFPDALKIIEQDGQRTEQQTWDLRWAIFYETSPGTRHSKVDLTEAEVVRYAEMILMVRRCHQGRM